jgi:hypothetical protein
MIYAIILLILLAAGCIGCLIWSNITSNKTLDTILTTIAATCLSLLFVVFGLLVTLPERDTAEAAKIETSEVEITPTDTEATVSITIPESITTEQLIKMFLDKWDGVLPDNITITIGD